MLFTFSRVKQVYPVKSGELVVGLVLDYEEESGIYTPIVQGLLSFP